MAKTAQIIINNPSKAVDKAFSYMYEGDLCVGDHVLVPFGKGNKITDGVVVGFEKNEQTDKLKCVAQVLENALSDKDVEILKWLRKKYVCTYFDALKLLLPPGSLSGTKRSYSTVSDKLIQFVSVSKNVENISEIVEILSKRSPAQSRVIEVLSETDKRAVTDVCDFADTSRSTLSALQKKGYIEIFSQKISCIL